MRTREKIILIVVCLVVCLSAYLLVGRPWLKGWPLTVNQAADRLIADLKEEDLVKLKNTPRDDLIVYHFDLGAAVRNEFGLWQGNYSLLIDSRKLHPDDASRVIIEAAWKKLNK